MKRTAIIAIFLLLSTFAFADEINMPRMTTPSAASNGFGGPHAAYTDNLYSLFVNPAAMIRVQERSFFALAPSIMNPQNTFSLAGAFMDYMMDDNGIDSVLEAVGDTGGRISLGLEFRELPLSIGWVANGFGFALMNNTFVNVNVESGSYVSAKVYEDIILPVGFAFKILETDHHAIDAGITLMPYARILLRGKTDLFKMMSGDTEDILDTYFDPVLAGFTTSIGLLYRWDAVGLQAGITFNDIAGFAAPVYTIIENDKDNSYNIPFSMDIGVAYEFNPGRYWPGLPGFVKGLNFAVAFDWHNFNNVFSQDDYLKRNSSLDIGLGLQVSLWDKFYFRCGMNEMLPALGLGVSFGALNIDLAYYGKELGNEPGQLSVAALDLSIAIRPQAKERDWIWARKSLLGMFGIGGKKQSDEKWDWDN